MSSIKYTPEEMSERGEAIYERLIRPHVEAGNRGKYVVIDIQTNDYEMDSDYHIALRRAKTKHPDGLFYVLRIGYLTAVKIGGAFTVTRS
ncbi:MAG TPA: hypothetical protein VFA07_17930 [Chthonomonadaceae bacterium]|nr:hypothetical protein [Chthonomonadaceae bacterium]